MDPAVRHDRVRPRRGRVRFPGRLAVLVLGMTLPLAGCGVARLALAANGSPGAEPPAMVPLHIRNPILDSGADPWAIRDDGWYYYTHTTGSDITLWRSESLSGIGAGRRKTVWTPPPGTAYSHDLWAPKILRFDDRWYIYFAAGSGSTEPRFADQRIWVLESRTDDPFGAYDLVGKIAADTDRWAIDGDVLVLGDRRYFAWSGWPGDENFRQVLYIAEMDTPWSVTGDRVLLSEPTFPWERRGGPPSINEGVRFLKHREAVHLVYSASGSWTDQYCLGLLTYDGMGDVLDPASWSKSDRPVFESGNGVVAPGHASFVLSPDGREDWIVFHSARQPGSGWDRVIRIQPFHWSDADVPQFGSPLSPDAWCPLPSGDLSGFPLLDPIPADCPVLIRSRFQSLALVMETAADTGRAVLETPSPEGSPTGPAGWVLRVRPDGTASLESTAMGRPLDADIQGTRPILAEAGAPASWRVFVHPEGYFQFRHEATGLLLAAGPPDTDGRRTAILSADGNAVSTFWTVTALSARPSATEPAGPTDASGGVPGCISGGRLLLVLFLLVFSAILAGLGWSWRRARRRTGRPG